MLISPSVTLSKTKSSRPVTFDLLGIGNAIVDVLSPATPAYLEQEGMEPGSMILVERDRALQLSHYLAEACADQVECISGGSAANTCVAASRLGLKTAYIGKIVDDEFGVIFRNDIQNANVYFPSHPMAQDKEDGLQTARCIILVTPDGQRTMNTYLGACSQLSVDDIIDATVEGSRYSYLEGYLFDRDNAKKAFYHVVQVAHRAKQKVALTLSDRFCVERHRLDFLNLIRSGVDLLFANEVEAAALLGVTDFQEIRQQIGKLGKFVVLTRGEKGSFVLRDDTEIEIPAVPTKIVDTTGAGDAYAAGFLTGLVENKALDECGHLGSLAASEVISHYGARLQKDIHPVEIS